MSEHELAHTDIQIGDLLAYNEGAANPALVRHIEQCAQCRHDLVGLRAADALLAATLLRATCPSPSDLLALQAGFVDAAQAAALQAHLAGCADCTAEFALIADPPRLSWREQALRAGARILQGMLQPAPSAAPAMRGDELRRNLYVAGDYQVIIEVTPPQGSNGSAQIEGQLITSDAAPLLDEVSVRLWSDDREWMVDTIDELGFFALDDVRAGNYTLVMVLDDTWVAIPGVQV